MLFSPYLLGRALDFAKEIDDFVGRNRDLRALELDSDDWDAVSQVAKWLKAFRSATTEMSKTKEPMLSTVHAIFRGLQDHVSSVLRELPDSAPSQLRTGLVEAHTKLSDYYFRSDESPYYTWAACEYGEHLTHGTCTHVSIYDLSDPSARPSHHV